MNGQGSFWSAFGVRFGNASSAIDEILEKEGHTLEELLDHDDIIQECKYLNSTLIAELSRKNVVEQLIRYVIQKPTEGKDEGKESKYPYIASELFACEVVSMLEVMFEHKELLELLFSFLDRQPPIDPSNAGYFRKVVVVLIQKKYEQLVQFIQGRGIVEKLVNHIGLYSIMELLIMIGWDDGLGQVNDVQWLYKEKLIPMLVAKLDPAYEKDEEVHVNAARALVDVVVKCPPSASSLLVTHLQSMPMLEKVFQYMLSGSLSSLNNCLSVVIVLVQRDANRRSEFPYDKIDLGMPPVIELVQKHLATILTVLTRPPIGKDGPIELKTQFGSLHPPFGETRMKAVELLLVLFRSNYPKINEDLARLKAIPPVLECFLAYPWNNMLHGLVESILRTVIDSDSEVLKKALFAESKLVETFIRGHQLNEEAQTKPKGNRLGYMGHLLRMCNAVVAAVEKDQQIRNFMADDLKAWNDFVTGPLAKENERQQTVIGGHRPTSPFRAGDGEEGGHDGMGYNTTNFDNGGMGTTSYLGPEEDSEHQQGYPFEHSADANDDDDDDDDEGMPYPNGSGQEFGSTTHEEEDFTPEWSNDFGAGGAGADGDKGARKSGDESGDSVTTGSSSYFNDDSDSDDDDDFNPRSALAAAAAAADIARHGGEAPAGAAAGGAGGDAAAHAAHAAAGAEHGSGDEGPKTVPAPVAEAGDSSASLAVEVVGGETPAAESPPPAQ